MTKSNMICEECKIWDLHIHSNQCDSASEDIKKLSIAEYVDQLAAIFDKYDDLEMISFTDHNRICFELYEEYSKKGHRVELLPGIEIDTCFEEGGISKHVIAYFDAMNDLDKQRLLAEEVNDILKNIDPKHPIYIGVLLDKLLDLKVPFAVSPHTQKQKKRSIDWDWHSIEKGERDSQKYADQFFCFWEASGHSSIGFAIKFLEEMDLEEKVSVVAFSDSKNFTDLEEYLSNPFQYFRALPSFNGIKMVGSEYSRIEENKIGIDKREYGGLIKKVCFADSEIYFSSGLNAIIGGRGSGKSVLLDSMAYCLNDEKCTLNRGRLDFLSQYRTVIYSYADEEVVSKTLNFDYFNQNYVSKLFEHQGSSFKAELEKYFSSAFSSVPAIDKEKVKSGNRRKFFENLSDEQKESLDNITGLIEKYKIDNKDRLNIKITKTLKAQTDKNHEQFTYVKMNDDFDKAIVKAIPAQVKNNAEVAKAILYLKKAVNHQVHLSHSSYLDNVTFLNDFIDLFYAKKKDMNDAQKQRSEIIKLFEDTFACESMNIRKRVALMNAIIDSCKDFRGYYCEKIYRKGESEDAFCFKKELHIQHPLNFIIKLFKEYFLVEKVKEECILANLSKYMEAFCFGESGYKSEKDWEKLYDAIKDYDLSYEEKSLICYRNEAGDYEDIYNFSPGMQTNILMEYIVHDETKRPLLIDQPEDNIDNQTIFDQIREWFLKLKTTRQVIVVTHDANIVINADAENVIVASRNKKGKFEGLRQDVWVGSSHPRQPFVLFPAS